MQGIILSYRRSKHEQTTNQAIVTVAGVENREQATKLVGKKVAWKSTHAVIAGEVASAHGNSGALRVRFERGIPGQAMNQTCEIQ